MMSKKKIRFTRTISTAFTCITMCGLLLAGCGTEKKADIPSIQLSLWGDERMIPLLEEGVAKFQETYKDQVNLQCTISQEGEDTCRDTILADPDHAADIFSFADDQFDDLYSNDVLLPITENADQIIADAGGQDSTVAQVVTEDGKVYAYPQTAGNGYFLYYNKAYYTEDDIQDLDTILKIASQKKKKFTMEFGNGWYIYSFFKGAGLDLSINEDGTANYCNWNATDTPYTGVDVANAMLDIAKNPGFVSMKDDEFVKGVQSGEIIAGINGAWNSSYVEEAWGEDYAAAKLPTYNLAGDPVQMSSFTGYKLMGISAKTKYPEWCMKLASILTSKEYQLKRFELLGECPVHEEAAKSEKVQSDPAIAALAAQAPYANIQRVASPYWDASGKFGITLAGGNSGGKKLQKLLDDTVTEITKKAGE